MDLNGLDRAFANSARQVAEIHNAMDALNSIKIEADKKFERREKENHDNIEYLSKSAQESNQILREMNETLRQNNALLSEKNEMLENSLEGINQVLQNIFDLNTINSEEQKELLQQANALACEIAVSLDKGEKINWKDKSADVGVQTVVSAIGLLLRMKGINI